MTSLAHSWKQQGFEKGKIKEKVTLVKKMLMDKEPVEKIVRYTNLTKEEIEKLK